VVVAFETSVAPVEGPRWIEIVMSTPEPSTFVNVCETGLFGVPVFHRAVQSTAFQSRTAACKDKLDETAMAAKAETIRAATNLSAGAWRHVFMRSYAIKRIGICKQ
jgi:hypothetical protein